MSVGQGDDDLSNEEVKDSELSLTWLAYHSINGTFGVPGSGGAVTINLSEMDRSVIILTACDVEASIDACDPVTLVSSGMGEWDPRGRGMDRSVIILTAYDVEASIDACDPVTLVSTGMGEWDPRERGMVEGEGWGRGMG